MPETLVTHTIQKGETLSGIGARFGVSWTKIYNHTSNVDFRKKRPDPNIIRPGDKINIPINVIWVTLEDVNVVGTKVSYLEYLRKKIDDGQHDIDELFKSMCQRYTNNARRWDALDDIDEIFGALYEILGRRYDKLDSSDKKRWVAVRDSLLETKKFKGEMDKLQHFVAGGGIAADAGEFAGWSAAWFAEKLDSFKRWWGDLWGTRLPHQIGFDWDDLQYTAAGASFEDFFDDLNEECCKSLIKTFADGSLSFSSIFTPDPHLHGGYGEFSPIVTPFVQTNIDIVDDRVADMESLLRNSLPTECR